MKRSELRKLIREEILKEEQQWYHRIIGGTKVVISGLPKSTADLVAHQIVPMVKNKTEIGNTRLTKLTLEY